jgi:hypothetical protein
LEQPAMLALVYRSCHVDEPARCLRLAPLNHNKPTRALTPALSM